MNSVTASLGAVREYAKAMTEGTKDYQSYRTNQILKTPGAITSIELILPDLLRLSGILIQGYPNQGAASMKSIMFRRSRAGKLDIAHCRISFSASPSNVASRIVTQISRSKWIYEHTWVSQFKKMVVWQIMPLNAGDTVKSMDMGRHNLGFFSIWAGYSVSLKVGGSVRKYEIIDNTLKWFRIQAHLSISGATMSQWERWG